MSGRRAPSPPGHPLLGHVVEHRLDTLGAYMRAFCDHGDVVRFRFGPVVAHLLVDPAHVEHVLKERAECYDKATPSYEKLGLIVGRGLLTSDGATWRRQRRELLPAFATRRASECGPLMVEAALATAREWERRAANGETVDVADEMARLALDVVGRAILGVELGENSSRLRAALDVAIEEVRYRNLHLVPPLSVPTPRNLALQRALSTLRAIASDVVERRRREGAEGGDLTALLLTADLPPGLSARERRHEIVDQVLTVLLAGHETTATALAWTWKLLAAHPAVARRLRDEVRDRLGGVPPTADDHSRLGYTRMVFQEALRLYPPAWVIQRRVVSEDVVGGYALPAGSYVLLSPWVTHRHPDHWPDPERFDPERFTPDEVAKRPRFAYFPFGGGPRVCIGAGFAALEATLVLAVLASRFELAAVGERDAEPDPSVTLRPRGGLEMRVRRLGAASA